MEQFLARHASLVTCTLSGFDRLVFRGTLMPLVRRGGMFAFLSRSGVRLLDFKSFVLKTSDRIKAAALSIAQRAGRPVLYLQSSKASKEDMARRILAQHPVDRPGLICTFKTVEPCMSFEYHRSPDPGERGLRLTPRKCLHIYQYLLHPTVGFMNVRLETWFPFNVQICLNGREWLATQLERQRSVFRRADNCFTWLENPLLAQRLLDKQLESNWPLMLSTMVSWVNPLHDEIFRPWPMDYYWSGYQTEWATDVVFKSPKALGSIYPTLVNHAMHHFHSPDVMRFLGRKAHGSFTGELTTSFKDRAEGVRVKHWVRGNSIKMYDKAGSILRVETTIGRTTDFKVLRPAHDDKPDSKLEWKQLRKGVADLHRRAQLSQRSNERYLDALAAVDHAAPCSQLFDAVARPIVHNGSRFRGIRIGDSHDVALLEAISHGEYATAGFRNRDIRLLLYPVTSTSTPQDKRRLAARTSRRLRMLRAHGLIRKVPKTHRYLLTERGSCLTAALHTVRNASIKQLLRQAA